MMADPFDIRLDRPIPIFPLPQCVLLPHATVPLHIFEQRYRAMIHDALEDGGMVAMAVFEGNRWQQEYEGTPPVRPMVCVGRIVRHETYSDGRYDILLQGISRARIVGEPPHESYRVAELEAVDSPALEIDLHEHRQDLVDQLNDPLLRELAMIGPMHGLLEHDLTTDALVDFCALALFRDTDHRYEFLANPDPAWRAQRVIRELKDIRRTLHCASRYLPYALQDEVGVN